MAMMIMVIMRNEKIINILFSSHVFRSRVLFLVAEEREFANQYAVP
jgi:hypothetical protein